MLSYNDFDILCVPVGTGGTLSGLIRSLRPSQFALGFSALKGGSFLTTEVKKYVKTSNWSIKDDYHWLSNPNNNQLPSLRTLFCH